MSNNLEKKESLSKIKVLYFIFNLLPLIALGFGITFTIVNGVVYNWHKTILIICIIISILVIAVSIAIVGAVRMIVYRKEHGMTKDVVKQQERNQKKYEKMFAEQEAEKKKNEKTKEQLEEEAKYDEVIVENKKITSNKEMAVIVVHAEIPSLRKVIFFKDKNKFDSVKEGDRIKIPAFDKEGTETEDMNLEDAFLKEQPATVEETTNTENVSKEQPKETVEVSNDENKKEDAETDEITQEAISKINDTNSASAPSPIEFKTVELNNKNN